MPNYTSLLASSSQWSLMAAPPDAMMDPSMMQNGFATSCLLAQPTLVEQSRMHHHEYMQRCLENGNGGLISQPSLTTQALIPSSNVACNLPMLLSTSMDRTVLTKFQVFLRLHIEAFAATDKDVTSRIRGRHKKMLLNQVGIRCRHSTQSASPWIGLLSLVDHGILPSGSKHVHHAFAMWPVPRNSRVYQEGVCAIDWNQDGELELGGRASLLGTMRTANGLGGHGTRHFCGWHHLGCKINSDGTYLL
jgi:hypothetical protein